MHEANSFVTLTYDDENVPSELVTKDWQDFAKRLRHSGRFRFFACGEYGDAGGRPHFHALIFGRDFSADRYPWRKSKGFPIYRSPRLEEAWGMGFAEIGHVSFQSARYVARYVTKKQKAESYEGRKPPFLLMSRRPGIGSTWFEKYGASDVLPYDECVVEGRRYRPPKFYDDRTDDQVLEVAKRKRIAAERKRESDRTPARLGVMEKVAARRLARLSREV